MKPTWSIADAVRTLLAGAVLLTGAACDGVLDVEDPQNLTGEEFDRQIQPEQQVELVIAGVVAEGQEFVDNWVRYSGMFVDEFVSAGTFPNREQVDERDIRPTNLVMGRDFYDELQGARFSADTAVMFFESKLGDEAFAGVESRLREGIALGQFWGGHLRTLLAEGYCTSSVANGPGLTSDGRMADALALLQAAETSAADAGRTDLRHAALVGQARAHLWLGQLDEARTAAQAVPQDFTLLAEYSNQTPLQKNEVHAFTHGTDGDIDGPQTGGGDGGVIRWSVGDGTVASRDGEAWPYLAEWISLGFIDPDPGLTAFESSVPVILQLKYDEEGAPIEVASGVEADFIEAEADLRQSLPGDAESIVNGYRAARGLSNVSFTGDLQDDLATFARERARELWITGKRMGTLRRLLRDGVDLFPPRSGTQTCFPVPQQEIDNNPNL